MLDENTRVQFHFLVQTSLQTRKRLKAFIVSMFSNENRSCESLQIIFCSDKSLLAINKEFLGHDYYTDIITFNLGSERRIEGEIYISVDRVKENARMLHQRISKELHRVIFHGVLHLCGYKDKFDKDIRLMREMEERYIREYFS